MIKFSKTVQSITIILPWLCINFDIYILIHKEIIITRLIKLLYPQLSNTNINESIS